MVLSERTLVILCLAICFAASAQDPCSHQFRSKARQYISNGEWLKGLDHFDRYRQNGGILNVHDLLGMAKAHMAMNDTVAAREKFMEAVQRGATWNAEDGSPSIEKELENGFPNWLTQQAIDYEQRRAFYLSQLDTALTNKINTMIKRDQFVRSDGRKMLSEEEFNKRIRTTDSLHLEEVDRIFVQHHGFPSDSLITGEVRMGLTLLIQHFTRGFPETFDHLAQVVKEAIARYQLHPSEYAVMVDRRQYEIDGKTIYGEVPYSKASGGSSVDNIRDIGQVDPLRYSIGLLSLKEHSVDRGFELPEGYVEQHSPCLMD